MSVFLKGELLMKTKKYNEMYSFIRVIMEVLSKKDTVEDLTVSEIFNSETSDMEEEDIIALYVYSSLFENKLLMMDEEKRISLAKSLYETYIRTMIYEFSCGNFEIIDKIYNLFSERIKVLSGFYGIYGDEYPTFKQYKKVI